MSSTYRTFLKGGPKDAEETYYKIEAMDDDKTEDNLGENKPKMETVVPEKKSRKESRKEIHNPVSKEKEARIQSDIFGDEDGNGLGASGQRPYVFDPSHQMFHATDSGMVQVYGNHQASLIVGFLLKPDGEWAPLYQEGKVTGIPGVSFQKQVLILLQTKLGIG